MTILYDVIAELFSMFVADAVLTVAILLIVAIAALLMNLSGVSPLVAGSVLTIGCPAVLLIGVWRAARSR